jgi:hypothetical protein
VAVYMQASAAGTQQQHKSSQSKDWDSVAA